MNCAVYALFLVSFYAAMELQPNISLAQQMQLFGSSGSNCVVGKPKRRYIVRF